MADVDEGLRAARAAKDKAARVLERFGRVRSVGITRRDGVYAVQVSLERAPDEEADVPDQIDGVPLVVRTTGTIRKQDVQNERNEQCGQSEGA